MDVLGSLLTSPPLLQECHKCNTFCIYIVLLSVFNVLASILSLFFIFFQHTFPASKLYFNSFLPPVTHSNSVYFMLTSDYQLSTVFFPLHHHIHTIQVYSRYKVNFQLTDALNNSINVDLSSLLLFVGFLLDVTLCR